MDWKKAEAMHEFVPTGLKPPCRPIACLQHAGLMERWEIDEILRFWMPMLIGGKGGGGGRLST